MSPLARQQRAFAQSLHDPMAAATCFGATQAGIGAYANNVLHNRADALANAFPIVQQLVGEEFFAAMARAAARAQASCSGDLHQYGGSFAQFIASFPPAQSLPYLADAARLDWACHRAYYAEQAAPFDLSQLAALTQDEQASLRFALHPAVALLDSAWPIVSLWRAHQPADSADWQDFPSPDQGGETALVWRNARQRVRVARLMPADAAFLHACADGLPFSEALERALDCDVEFDLAVSLQRWITDQVIIHHLPGEPT